MSERSPLDPLRSGLRILREDGPRQAARDGAYFTYESLLRALCRLRGEADAGDHIYDAEWDVLLVLDACRVDLLEEVADEYEFLGEIETRRSVGSASAEWMRRTFGPPYQGATSRTAYVTGNPFSDAELSAERFAALREVWRTDWDDEAGTIRPRPLTDAAIRAHRKGAAERVVVHYMQPHYPFLAGEVTGHGLSTEEWGAATQENVWTRLRDGALDREAVWAAYRETLRVVLDDVALLLESIDAERVVITADHGNAVGEWGVYGHPRGVCLPAIREVPWVETTATRERAYEPTSSRTEEEEAADDDTAVSDRLDALGYT